MQISELHAYEGKKCCILYNAILYKCFMLGLPDLSGSLIPSAQCEVDALAPLCKLRCNVPFMVL